MPAKKNTKNITYVKHGGGIYYDATRSGWIVANAQPSWGAT